MLRLRSPSGRWTGSCPSTPAAVGQVAALTGSVVRVPGLVPITAQALPDFLLRGQNALPIAKQARKDLLDLASAQVLRRP